MGKGYFIDLRNGLTREEQAFSRALLDLRHLLETGQLSAAEVRSRMADLAKPPFPPAAEPREN